MKPYAENRAAAIEFAKGFKEFDYNIFSAAWREDRFNNSISSYEVWAMHCMIAKAKVEWPYAPEFSFPEVKDFMSAPRQEKAEQFQAAVKEVWKVQ